MFSYSGGCVRYFFFNERYYSASRTTANRNEDLNPKSIPLYSERERERERQTDRQRDRQTDRQTDRQRQETDTQAYRQTDTQTDRDREADRQTGR